MNQCSREPSLKSVSTTDGTSVQHIQLQKSVANGTYHFVQALTETCSEEATTATSGNLCGTKNW